jgi:hypothetical protein
MSKSSRPELNSYLNCNPINPRIQEDLSEYGVKVRRIKGSVSSEGHLPGAEEHMFLEIPASEIGDYSGEPLIVDGALDQFCQENYDEGIVFQNFGPRESIPCPAVLKPSDELYSVFLYDEPW